jgi:hypothetical protein
MLTLTYLLGNELKRLNRTVHDKNVNLAQFFYCTRPQQSIQLSTATGNRFPINLAVAKFDRMGSNRLLDFVILMSNAETFYDFKNPAG